MTLETLVPIAFKCAFQFRFASIIRPKKLNSTRRHIPLHTALPSIYQRENKHNSTATAIHTR